MIGRRLLLLFFAVCFAAPAMAQGWSMPGSGCVPNDITAKFERHLHGNATVQHAPANVDLIIVTCPVTGITNETTNWVVSLTYRDSTGTGAQSYVLARLYRMAVGTTNPVLLAQVNSNKSPAIGISTVNSPPFTHTFDFTDNVYWIRVQLDRAATNQLAILYSVALTPPLISDLRAKHNVALLGRLDNGLGFYRFSYLGSGVSYVGVMAQDVEAVRPDAVVRGSDGYLRVHYSLLGFGMQSWEEWVATGEMIPAISEPLRQ